MIFNKKKHFLEKIVRFDLPLVSSIIFMLKFAGLLNSFNTETYDGEMKAKMSSSEMSF